MSTLAAVLWDMDGTIVDTEPFWVDSERALVEQYGGSWSDADAMECVGKSLEASGEILRQAGVELSVADIIAHLTDEVMARLAEPNTPFQPGVRDLMLALQEAGIPQALVTMSHRRMAEVVVDLLPEGTFDVIVAGDEVEHGKPHPDPYLRAAAALGVAPESCIAFEDSPTGVRSAVAANVCTIGVPHMVPLDAVGATVLWSSIADHTVTDLIDLHERFTR